MRSVGARQLEVDGVSFPQIILLRFQIFVHIETAAHIFLLDKKFAKVYKFLGTENALQRKQLPYKNYMQIITPSLLGLSEYKFAETLEGATIFL